MLYTINIVNIFIYGNVKDAIFCSAGKAVPDPLALILTLVLVSGFL